MSGVFLSEAVGAEIHARYRDLLTFWPGAHEPLFVPTRQGETFVMACGAQGAPPLVLLHGSMSVAAAWMGDAAAWSERFRIYAVDLIGEPGLSAPSRPPLDGDAYAAWLDDVMDGLDLERAAFVGMSLGGWLALDYAMRRPGRVERLALLCPAGVGRQRYFALRVALQVLLGPWGVRKVREWAFGPTPRDLPPIARKFVELMALINRGVRPRMARIPVFDDAALRVLTLPMLVILGGRDLTIDSFDTRRRLARTNPTVEIEFRPDAGHHIPDRTEAVLAFLSRPTSG